MNARPNVSEFYELCRFGGVKTLDEYNEVLSLRHLAYLSDNKIASDKTVADMADEFDLRSKILTAKYKERIVGSVRIIFHSETDTLSYGRYFEIPVPQLPKRENYAEASRMCVHPDFRGFDLFYHLAVRMILSAVDSHRRFIVGGSTSKLLPKWENCGFRAIGVRYLSKDIANVEHDLIILDTQEVLLGDNISDKMRKYLFSVLDKRCLGNEPN